MNERNPLQSFYERNQAVVDIHTSRIMEGVDNYVDGTALAENGWFNEMIRAALKYDIPEVTEAVHNFCFNSIP